MPQSLSLVLIHVIFSTKDRVPFIKPTLRPKLHAYLATVTRNLDCDCFLVGGVEDHVHLAIGLSRTITIAKLVEQIKTSSSKFLKTDVPNFAWQRGYGVFSVNPSDLPALKQYMATQEQHHQKQTFQDELRTLLQEFNIPYNDQYLWDEHPLAPAPIQGPKARPITA
jgi:REP element-mobilizing transposase RayT